MIPPCHFPFLICFSSCSGDLGLRPRWKFIHNHFHPGMSLSYRARQPHPSRNSQALPAPPSQEPMWLVCVPEASCGVELLASCQTMKCVLGCRSGSLHMCSPPLWHQAVSCLPISPFSRARQAHSCPLAGLCSFLGGCSREECGAVHLLPFLGSPKILNLPSIPHLVFLPLYQGVITFTLEEILTKKIFWNVIK